MKKIIIGFFSALLAFVLTRYFFAPAFAGQIEVSPVLVLGSVTIRWYGLFIAGAVGTGFWLMRKHAWKFGIDRSELDDYAFWLVIVSLIGARAYFVAFESDYFLSRPVEILQIWKGGLSLFGALFSGLLFTILFTRNRAYGTLKLLDLVAMSLPLAQALGRFGNFFNYEAFGLPTSLPWKMYVPPISRPENYLSYDFFHPAFLYEALWLVAVFFILRSLGNHNRPGVVFWSYLVLYSFGRFFIEPLRLDSVIFYGFRVDQMVALLVFSASLLMLKKSRQTVRTS